MPVDVRFAFAFRAAWGQHLSAYSLYYPLGLAEVALPVPRLREVSLFRFHDGAYVNVSS